MVATPLHVDIRHGAVSVLPEILSESRISTTGSVLVAVGRSTGEEIWAQVSAAMPGADVFVVDQGSLAAAGELQAELGTRGYDAVVGIGGGRTIDVAKYAATRAGIPMVAVATNLAHDGICSPVASLEHRFGKGSFGVAMPLAVVVDLDYVKAAPRELVTAGVGDVVSNLSAIEDWLLAEHERGEKVDGLALSLARAAGLSVLQRADTVEDDDFVVVLAEALVLSGMAMSVAGTSRPCSGACHEVVHALDAMFPGRFNHGELAGVGACFATFLRGEEALLGELTGCLTRHGLATGPAGLGLSAEEFTQAVLAAPATRPDRYTILEHLDLDPAGARRQVEAFGQRLETLLG